ncbi:MAG: PAS domain-containing protein [Parvibaculum sp.]
MSSGQIRQTACAPIRRSEKSRAFEAAWRGIPATGFIPDKTAFRAEHFAPFLNDIYLIELHDDRERRLLFRIAGQAIREALGLELKGQNYIDFVPPEDRERSGLSMRLMFGARPCGRWVGKQIVHTDGFRQPIELTQFPMMDADGGTRLVIGIAEGFATALEHEAGGEFRFESHEAECFIDIGAGLPD